MPRTGIGIFQKDTPPPPLNRYFVNGSWWLVSLDIFGCCIVMLWVLMNIAFFIQSIRAFCIIKRGRKSYFLWDFLLFYPPCNTKCIARNLNAISSIKYKAAEKLKINLKKCQKIATKKSLTYKRWITSGISRIILDLSSLEEGSWTNSKLMVLNYKYK